MNVDTGARVRVFAHHTRDQRHALPVERVGDPVHGNRVKAGVAHHDLHGRDGGGIAFIRRLNILFQHVADGGQTIQKRCHGLTRFGFTFAAVFAFGPLAGVFEGTVGLIEQPQCDAA